MHDARPAAVPRLGPGPALHATLWVADLHADSLLWGRDLLQRATRGHVDVPRLIEGNVALQVLAATTKSPRHLNIERNDDRSDDVMLLALALGWPPRDVAEAAAARAPPGRPCRRAGGALRRRVHGHPLARGPGRRTRRRGAIDRGSPPGCSRSRAPTRSTTTRPTSRSSSTRASG